MFNPYHARPIGSEAFEKHLAALMIEGIETQNAVKEALPEYKVVPEAAKNGTVLSDPITEGYKALDTAILAQAIVDYLTEYEARLKAERTDWLNPRALVHTSRCLELENEYFREDEGHAMILDYILRHVIHCSPVIDERLNAIRKLRSRIKVTVGWS